jgi:hypothetical protein
MIKAEVEKPDLVWKILIDYAVDVLGPQPLRGLDKLNPHG